MTKKILVDAVYPNETRVVVLNKNEEIEFFEYQTSHKAQIKGNIYIAKVIRIEPSLQAVFIDYGGEKNGFLSFSEIHPSYYKKTDDISSFLKSLKTIEFSPEDVESNDIKFEAMPDEDEDIVEQVKKIAEDESWEEKATVEKPLDVTIDEEIADIDEEKPYIDPSRIEGLNLISSSIQKGQMLLVQAVKEERGNKGASFTTFVSLAGRYCVLMPNIPKKNGISRKISSFDERKRLKNIISEISSSEPNDASIIVRTAGIYRTSYEIKRDCNFLVKLWNKIAEIALKTPNPGFIHMEEDLIQKTMRDLFEHQTSKIIVQGEEAYKLIMTFMKAMIHDTDASKVLLYKGKIPLFSKYKIEEQLSVLYSPVAKLPSGGYMVINPTEALTAIDVNSGKLTSERNIEETAFKTNLEAAFEISKQIKLRDLSGLIVIDFIDMHEYRNRKIIERSLREFLKIDRARIQVGSISPFGLLEMSRQRLKPSFLEANTTICNHCHGKGLVRADESNAMLILRTIENEIYKSSYAIVNIYANLDNVLYITNEKREIIQFIEQKYSVKLKFLYDHQATSDSFSIEKIRSTSEKEEKKLSIISLSSLFNEIDFKANDKVVPIKNSPKHEHKHPVRSENKKEVRIAEVKVEPEINEIPEVKDIAPVEEIIPEVKKAETGKSKWHQKKRFHKELPKEEVSTHEEINTPEIKVSLPEDFIKTPELQVNELKTEFIQPAILNNVEMENPPQEIASNNDNIQEDPEKKEGAKRRYHRYDYRQKARKNKES